MVPCFGTLIARQLQPTVVTAWTGPAVTAWATAGPNALLTDESSILIGP